MKGYALAALVAFCAAWLIQGWRWDADVSQTALAAAQAQVLAVQAVNKQRLDAEATVATGQQVIDRVRIESDGKDVELQRLNDCLRTGKCGLRVAAKCPGAGVRADAVPGPASGNTGGTLGLDADLVARALVWEREYPKQLKALKLCKAYAEQMQKR
jgi:hypothetical protein